MPPSRQPQGVPTGGQFAPSAHAESAVTLADPTVPAPDVTMPRDAAEARSWVTDDLVARYTLGDCHLLAHELAVRNDWGLTIVGEVHEDEWGDEEHPSWEVSNLVHAYAVRPDGCLVDIRGVHEPQRADDLAAQWAAAGVRRYDYATAAEADAIWDHAQWAESDEDFEMAEWAAGIVSVYGSVEQPGETTATAPVPSWDEAHEWAQDFFETEDGEPYAACCQVSEWARGMCCEVSENFADYLHSIGETSARTLDLDATEGHPYVHPGSPHTVVEVRGLIVDLTHRQFDPDADVPHAMPSEEFLTGWRVVGHE